MAAALCRACDRFFGAESQFNNISTALHIAIVENPNIAMLYGEELHHRLHKYARERRPLSIIFSTSVFTV